MKTLQEKGCSKKCLIISGSVVIILIIGAVSGLVYNFNHLSTSGITDETELSNTRDLRSMSIPKENEEENKGLWQVIIVK